jgi:hypothetical protein
MTCESKDDFLMGGGMDDGKDRSMLVVGAVGAEATPCEPEPCPNLSKLRRSVLRVELLPVASGAGVFNADVFGL